MDKDKFAIIDSAKQKRPKIYGGSEDEIKKIPVSGTKNDVRIVKPALMLNSIRKLYGSSGAVRELVLNGMDAVIAAIRNEQIRQEDGLVSVTIHGNRIIIEDNGTGISWDVFKDLKTMAGLGNNSGECRGVFGLGFFAHVVLTDKIIIDSKTTDNDNFIIVCINGETFEEIGKSKRSKPGTTISMNSPRANIDHEELAGMLARIGAVTKVNFEVRMDGISRMPMPEKSVGTSIIENGMAFHAGRVGKIVEKWKEDKFTHVIEFSDRDFEMTAMVSSKLDIADSPLMSIRGMPIEPCVEIPINALINVTNDHVLRPQNGRNKLSENATVELQKRVDNRIKLEIENTKEIVDYPSYTTSRYKLFFNWCMDNPITLNDKYDIRYTKEIDILNRKIFTNQNGESLSIFDFLRKYHDKRLLFNSDGHKHVDSELENSIQITPLINHRDDAAEVAAGWGIPHTD